MPSPDDLIDPRITEGELDIAFSTWMRASSITQPTQEEQAALSAGVVLGWYLALVRARVLAEMPDLAPLYPLH